MIIDLERAIESYHLPLETCLHVGAHHGHEDEVYERLNIKPIYIEADSEVYRVLVDRLPHRECHQLAISDECGTTELHITSLDQSSSILPLKKVKRIYPEIVEERVIRVSCNTIDGL